MAEVSFWLDFKGISPFKDRNFHVIAVATRDSIPPIRHPHGSLHCCNRPKPRAALNDALRLNPRSPACIMRDFHRHCDVANRQHAECSADPAPAAPPSSGERDPPAPGHEPAAIGRPGMPHARLSYSAGRSKPRKWIGASEKNIAGARGWAEWRRPPAAVPPPPVLLRRTNRLAGQPRFLPAGKKTLPRRQIGRARLAGSVVAAGQPRAHAGR